MNSKYLWQIEAYRSFMRGDEECWNLDDVMSYRSFGLSKGKVLSAAMTKAKKYFKHTAANDFKLKVRATTQKGNQRWSYESHSAS